MKTNKLREKIIKDFGKRCKTRSCICACCQAHYAIDILEELYNIK